MSADMVPGRRREFLAARTIARHALHQLCAPSTPILSGPGGEPLWSGNVVGSLSHTWSHVGALVARKDRYLSVGLDLDDDRAIDEAAAADLFFPEETELLLRSGTAPRNAIARRLLFSAKEAVYKCQYPLTGERSLDFLDVRLCASAPAGRGFAIKAAGAAATGLVALGIEVFFVQLHEVIAAYALAPR